MHVGVVSPTPGSTLVLVHTGGAVTVTPTPNSGESVNSYVAAVPPVRDVWLTTNGAAAPWTLDATSGKVIV